MIYDLQKASVLKRISAWLLDFILLIIIITGAAWLLSEIAGFEKYTDTLESVQEEYESTHSVSFDISEEDFAKLSEEKQDKINGVYDEFSKDERVTYAFNMVFNLVLLISSLSVLLGYVITELIVPLILKNGQTVGKKIFAIGVMQVNGVRLTPVALFTRTILGKYTVETMVPIIIIAMFFLGAINIVGILVIALILIFELVLVIKTRTNSMIHDVFAFTVTVDLPSQMIFETEAELIDYKKRIHAEAADNASYN